VKTELRCR